VPEPATGVAVNTVEVRFTGGMLALNRLLMTLQNKRMPVAGFTLGRDGEGMRATILLDCPTEPALRYTAIISALEDVEEAGPAETVEVALVGTAADWHPAADRAGIAAHEDGGMVVASGRPGEVDGFLAALGQNVEDVVRLGPVARPERGVGGGV
jgi:hypothetical protein